MSAAEWLDRVDAVAREATEGPWALVLAWDSAYGTNYGADAPYDKRDGQWQDDDPWPVMRGGMEEDAAFIVAARTAVPAMSAALRAVLDLHRPEMGWGRIPNFCGVDGRDWPCPTVRAITEALT